MQRPWSITLSPAAADDDAISLSQTPAAGGTQSLTITGALAAGGVATLDMPRRVDIASGGNDSARTFVVTGTYRGNDISESILGGNIATVTTLKDFSTVTGVTIDGNSAGTVKVGIGQTISSAWVVLDHYDSNGCAVGAEIVSGTATWQLETTLDNPFPSGNVNPAVDIYLKPSTHPSLQGKTVSDIAALDSPAMAVRLTITAYVAGVVKFKGVPGAVGGM